MYFLLAYLPDIEAFIAISNFCFLRMCFLQNSYESPIDNNLSIIDVTANSATVIKSTRESFKYLRFWASYEQYAHTVDGDSILQNTEKTDHRETARANFEIYNNW